MTYNSHGAGTQTASSISQKTSLVKTLRSPVVTLYLSDMVLQSRGVGCGFSNCPAHVVFAAATEVAAAERFNVAVGAYVPTKSVEAEVVYGRAVEQLFCKSSNWPTKWFVQLLTVRKGERSL